MIAVWYSGLGWIPVGIIFIAGIIKYITDHDNEKKP